MKINPNLCSFQTSKLLKEKGFDVEGFYYYLDVKDRHSTYPMRMHNYMSDDWNKEKTRVSCPEHWMVIDWIKLKYNIWIYVTIFQTDTQYYCQAWIQQLNKEDVCVQTGDISHTPSAFNSPKEAYEAAFEYILTNLQHSCKGIQIEGASCNKNNNCTYPNCGEYKLINLL
jgi:hypothetical protein